MLDRGFPCAICTAAATRGSTPQKPGAMMLVYADGSQSGTLGGGCVESEVKKRVLADMTAGMVESRIYEFNLDDDYGWDDGLICGGQMTIAVEQLSKDHRDYYQSLHGLLEVGDGFTEVIALEPNTDSTPGSRALFRENGKQIASIGLLRDFVPIERALRPGVVNGHAVLPKRARITLLIVGGGHVGQAVARLATELDFEIWILDDREMYANIERFPTASRRFVGDIGRELQSLRSSITPSIYCLIVTRGHNHDEEALFQLVNTPAGYIGMIGSKRKIRLIFDDLRAKGISDEALSRVRAPIGLDIGSQTVPEIAISILAELIARRNLAHTSKKSKLLALKE